MSKNVISLIKPNGSSENGDTPKDLNCTDCVHVHENSKLEGGGFICRYAPPQVCAVYNGQGFGFATVFPQVSDKMICGAFETEVDEVPTN